MNKRGLFKTYDKLEIRKLSDMKDFFKNPNKRGNPVIYKVYRKVLNNYEVGLTIINPGAINKEYYMTKGHRHKKPFSEVYILEEGKGKLILQEKRGKESRIVELKKDQPFIVPGKMAHRLVNTGNQKLKVITIYHKDSSHDYSIKFSKRLFKK